MRIKLKLKVKFLNKRLNYDGSQLRALWALEELGLQGSSIVVFRGGMNVAREQMRDLKDKREGREIKGENLIHFIVEVIDPNADLRLAYYAQRLLLCITKDKLMEFGVKVAREGGDLYFNGKKLSVSIANSNLNGYKIHLGLNITSKQAPEGAIGLREIDRRIKPMEIARAIANQFAVECEDIERDIAKTRAFG
ncbi:MAG: DUF366 family protein [Methanocellales archaeon]